MQLWIARSAREISLTVLADPANLPRATRTRQMRLKKKMLVPLKPQQKKTNPSTNMRKVASKTGKTTAKTPGSRMKKIPRKKLHQGTKANRRRWIRQIPTTTMMILTEPVPRTTLLRRRWRRRWQEYQRRRRLHRMDAVPDPECAIGNVWCYGKGQSILLKKSRKTRRWEKVRIKSTEGKGCKETCK